MPKSKGFDLANDPRIVQIANHYGFGQTEKLIEEMAELMVAIKHLYRLDEDFRKYYDDFIEELGDVKILIAQLDVLLRDKDAIWDTLQRSIDFKIERELTRIGADDAEK